ncbi:hypothetical protein IJG14_02405 [bacterium]|nr:hypothetical protein [bacterium]
MAFVQSSSFEATAPTSSGGIPSSENNPFGLKDFSRLLDSKFGNSAFSDNILAAPPGAKENINPFSRENQERLKLNTNYYNSPTANPYIKPKPMGSPQTKPPSGASIYSDPSLQGDSTDIFGGGFNKGTGMTSGGRSRHKLDFCY